MESARAVKPKYASVGDRFKHNGMWNYRVSFVPAVSVKCDPPYVRGVQDSLWIATAHKLPKPTDKEGWEQKLGMTLLPLPAC